MTGMQDISAIVAAYQRIEQTLDTLRRLEACDPRPAEILVHVDAGGDDCAKAVRVRFPHITVIESRARVGPGGARNRLIREARHELVASFDDDSYPMDNDFFARAATFFRRYPDTALVTGVIFHPDEDVVAAEAVSSPTASFGSGGSVFRRSAFLEAGGFVPLPIAYGMEEEDLALRLIESGRELRYTPWLRVYHDADRSRHGAVDVNAAVIANIALLAFLRYPATYWPYGMLQIVNRVAWCVKVGRRAGLVRGLLSIPSHLWRHRHHRAPVSVLAMRARAAARVRRLEAFRADVATSSGTGLAAGTST